METPEKKPYHRHSRHIVVGAVITSILILFLIGFIPRLNNWKEIQAIADQEDEIITRLMEVQSQREPITLTLPSSTNAMHVTPIWARVDGYLENFLVDIGDHVKEGQLLATIETPELDKQLLQARADLIKAKAEYDIAKISAERWAKLYQVNPQAVPKQEVDERSATLNSSKANVESFQANVERLEKLQAFKYILAPFNGIITQRTIDIGSLITAGSAGTPQQLFQIEEIDTIRVFADVPQAFFRLIKDGITTDVIIQEFPNHVFKGTVVRTARALDPIARTLLTEIHIDNHDELLTSGLYANVNFSLIPDEAYFLVPSTSIIITNGGPNIAVLDQEDKVQIVPVTLGRDYGKTIEITSGLKNHDRIVINPDGRIRNGVKVLGEKENKINDNKT